MKESTVWLFYGIIAAHSAVMAKLTSKTFIVVAAIRLDQVNKCPWMTLDKSVDYVLSA